jgi:hypothetical protein
MLAWRDALDANTSFADRSVMLSAVGAFLGTVCSIWMGPFLVSIAWVWSRLYAGECFAGLLGCGVRYLYCDPQWRRFGIMPAWRAARIDPALALQFNGAFRTEETFDSAEAWSLCRWP